jgi:tRNA(Arg) A34 adenosine deaminase TadA
MKCSVSDIHKRLVRKASRSPCRFQISAIGIDHRGRVIISRTNRPRFSRHGGGIHAEMAVMLNAPRSLRTIIIVRVNRHGDLMPIDPCETCAGKARELGITIRTLKG